MKNQKKINNNCSSCESQRSYFPVYIISPHSRLYYFVERSSYLRLKTVFVRLELSCGSTIAAKFGQVVVDLKLEVK